MFKKEKYEGIDSLGLGIISEDNMRSDVIMWDFAVLICFKRVNVVSFINPL